jgi:hypothetical protein
MLAPVITSGETLTVIVADVLQPEERE